MIRDVLRSMSVSLQIVNLERSQNEARLLLSKVLNTTPEELLIHDNRTLSPDQIAAANALLKRRLSREPIAYILEKKEFYNLEFEVSPAVLIPRPETESLVSGVLKWIHSKGLESGSVLDLGTGSGCIAISLAKNLGPAFQICGIDKSEEALTIACANSKKHLLSNLSWKLGDLTLELESPGRIDVVVSNPPYIPTGELKHLQDDIKNFEPEMALDGGTEGIDLIERILKLWPTHLSRPGLIAIETLGPSQQEILKLKVAVEGVARIWHDGPHIFYEF